MTISSPKELTQIVKSNANKLAATAITLIKNGGPLSELQALVADGCPHVLIERSSSHPRSQYRIIHVLDACFESRLGVLSTQKTETATISKIGTVHASRGREIYFKFLLEAGFTPGDNNWRGPLFAHIVNSCFYADEPANQQSALVFAKILIDAGKVAIQDYVRRSYQWTGSREKLNVALALGASPSGSEMIDCAISYVGCAVNSRDPKEGRVDVIKELLALGAAPSDKRPFKYPLDQHMHRALDQAGLLQQMIDSGAVSHHPPFKSAA